MSPFRRKDRRPGWYIQPRLPDGRRIGPFWIGTNKREATDVESAIFSTWRKGYRDLIDRVATREIRIQVLYAHYVEGTLAELRTDLTSPSLTDAVASYRSFVKDARTREGLGQILALAPDGARLSWLMEPKNITKLYADAVEGKDLPQGRRPRKPNSVRRSLHRAVSELLAHELGKSEKVRIMIDVKIPGEKDERDVILAPEEIGRLINTADEEFRPFLQLAILTGVDVTPLLNLVARDFDREGGTLRVRDTKTPYRYRTLSLGGTAWQILSQLTAGMQPEEQIFHYRTRWQVRKRWDWLRVAAKLPHVRFKDLRGVYATHHLESGGSLRALSAVLGHGDLKTTMRYVKQLPQGYRDEMEAAARSMGLDRPSLKVEEGGGA